MKEAIKYLIFMYGTSCYLKSLAEFNNSIDRSNNSIAMELQPEPEVIKEITLPIPDDKKNSQRKRRSGRRRRVVITKNE